MFLDLWPLWVAILCFGTIGVIRLCQAQAEAKRTEQRDAAEAERLLQEKARAIEAQAVRLRMMTPGTELEYGERIYTVLSLIIFANPTWHLPNYWFELEGGEARTWLSIQMRNMCGDKVELCEQQDFSEPPDRLSHQSVMLNGRAFQGGLWGGNYYYLSREALDARQPAGVARYVVCSPEDSRADFGQLELDADHLRFYQLEEGGPWVGCLAKSLEAMEINLLDA